MKGRPLAATGTARSRRRHVTGDMAPSEPGTLWATSIPASVGASSMAASASALLLGSPPIPRTRLIGREAERAAAKAFLLDEAVPLLTLTGPGGVGKTRLALAIASDVASAFVDGVVWIDLAPLTDPTLVPATVAAALGVIPTADGPPIDDIARALRSQHRLLLLDNCEHVLADTADLVGSLLSRCAPLQVLTTSRAPLHLHGEQCFVVEPLPLPAEAAARDLMEQNDAVQLFIERARGVRPAFTLTESNAATVATLCRQLDGLPLAIELAAARSIILSPDALLAQMDDRLQLLTHGMRNLPPRQQTIMATIAWSHDLLDVGAQALFRRLAVFAGGFPLAAVEVVGGPGGEDALSVLDGVTSLAAQSLLHQVEEVGAEPRYVMLETIREYARERLDASGEAEETWRRHAEFYLRFGEALAARLGGMAMAETLTQLSTELPNLRLALAWAIEQGRDVDAGLGLAAALSPFWRFRGHLSEGRRWLDAALTAGPTQMTTRIDGLVAAAELAIFHGEYTTARALGEAGLELATLHHYPGGEARALFMLAMASDFQDDLDRAVPHYRQALARRDDLAAPDASRLLACLAGDYQSQGDLDQAEALATKALALAREAGHAWSEVLALGVLAHIAVAHAEYAEGLRLGLECFGVAQTLGAKLGMAGALGTLAGVFLSVGQPERATRLLASGRAIADAIGVVPVANNDYFEHIRTAARLCLSEQAFAAAWAAGWTLSPEEALAEILAEQDPFLRSLAKVTGNGTDLTPRELEVLRLMVEGRSDRQIADALFISPKTAGNHVSSILAKLGISTRAAAAAQAVRRSLV
jgi:predicted ATPase/DNA-binding CsgD family transcriptional regulator